MKCKKITHEVRHSDHAWEPKSYSEKLMADSTIRETKLNFCDLLKTLLDSILSDIKNSICKAVRKSAQSPECSDCPLIHT